MKQVNVTFQFSKDCPYNLDGTFISKGTVSLSCGIGKNVPPSWCPLPTAENSGAQPAQTGSSAMLSASQINIALKAMEYDEHRMSFISECMTGICHYCGQVTDRCYCMCND